MSFRIVSGSGLAVLEEQPTLRALFLKNGETCKACKCYKSLQ